MFTPSRALMVVVLATASLAFGGDWTAFRGSERTGIIGETGTPLRWSREQNIRWKAALPGPGNGSPIVVGDRVFIVCTSDELKARGLYCFALADGKPLWSRVVRYEKDDPTHPTNPWCGNTPASDGQRVVAWHGSAGIFCYDLDGRELWSRDLGEARHIWGYGSSPLFHQGRVLLNFGPGPRQALLALDGPSGKTLWQTDEPGGATGEDGMNGGKPLWTGSWSTPVIARIEGQEQVLVSFPKHVQAYDPATGKVLWSVDGLGDLVYTDPLVGEGVGVAMGGYHGPAIGFRLGGTGDMTEKNRLWRVASRNPQRIGSGVIVGPHVFMVNEIGVVQCLDVATGSEVWKERLPGAKNKIWGSLILAEGRLYTTNDEATTYVLAANPAKFELLATNPLGEHTNSTLAFASGRALLRTYEHLWCIAGEGP